LAEHTLDDITAADHSRPIQVISSVEHTSDNIAIVSVRALIRSYPATEQATVGDELDCISEYDADLEKQKSQSINKHSYTSSLGSCSINDSLRSSPLWDFWEADNLSLRRLTPFTLKPKNNSRHTFQVTADVHSADVLTHAPREH